MTRHVNATAAKIHRYAVVAMASALAAVGQAAPQDQVIKPTAEPLVTARLAAPKPTARQSPDGRITVTWLPIEGAVRYRLWRSVPPSPVAEITPPNPADAQYVDTDVKAGSTYYYVVSAVSESGIEGLKGSTAPLTASISATPTITSTAPTVSARLLVADPPRIAFSFTPVEGATGYVVARQLFVLSSQTDPSGLDLTKPYITTFPDFAATRTYGEDNLVPTTGRRAVVYSVTPKLTSAQGQPSLSPVLFIPAGSDATSASSATAAGSTTFTVAARATVKIGATTSLLASSGSPARWVSLNESVATVDASGTVTGRSAGNTQIVALATSSDGSLRVAAIPLSVTP